ncbi:hypothetical protein EIP86_006140 [Pleurotus ostreatoroseus]|nr:hypothetical protein EIP86_006140 [Pleurotus ostreatoroseus]
MRAIKAFVRSMIANSAGFGVFLQDLIKLEYPTSPLYLDKTVQVLKAVAAGRHSFALRADSAEEAQTTPCN